MCKFIVSGVSYNCVEQYMMAEKARLFGDRKAEEKIINSCEPSEQKLIGRTIMGFDDKLWISKSRDIVYKANKAKFTQNRDLMQVLLGTKDKYLAEASTDKRWGIGLEENLARKIDRTQWPGTNWCGEILMRVRKELRGKAA